MPLKEIVKIKYKSELIRAEINKNGMKGIVRIKSYKNLFAKEMYCTIH